MTTPSQPASVDVTQEDREAAACYFETTGDQPRADHARSGQYDLSAAVQSFARHRHASLAPAPSDRPAVSEQAGEGYTVAHALQFQGLLVDVPKTWRSHGYKSEAEEIADMANVGRALMEALPEGYSYMNCPSEIVSDLQNERDEALALAAPVSRNKVAEAANDEGPIADAARNIASWAEGDARVYVYQAAKRHLSALALAQPAAGWKLVPVEPTPEMLKAAWKVIPQGVGVRSGEVWSAMLAAVEPKL